MPPTRLRMQDTWLSGSTLHRSQTVFDRRGGCFDRLTGPSSKQDRFLVTETNAHQSPAASKTYGYPDSLASPRP